MSRRMSWTSERKRSGSAPRTKSVTPVSVLLRERLVEVGSRLLAERAILAVPDDSRKISRHSPSSRAPIELHASSQSLSRGKVARDERLARDHHRLRSSTSDGAKCVPPSKRDPHRPKVVEPDDIRRTPEALRRGIEPRRALNRERRPPPGARRGTVRARLTALTPGRGSRPFDHLAVESSGAGLGVAQELHPELRRPGSRRRRSPARSRTIDGSSERRARLQ